MSGPFISMVALFDPPVERVHRHVELSGRVPAFQAGCREFESRLPLFPFNRRSQPASQAPLEQATCESISRWRFCFVSKGVQRTPAFFLANTCFAFHVPTKVFANLHRQVVSTWNCLPSNYRTSLHKIQGRQVFTMRDPCNSFIFYYC